MMAAREQQPQHTLKSLLAGIAAAPALPVAGVALDSRQSAPGYVFLACQGLTVHGLHYLHQALRLGAAAVAWEPAPGIEAPRVPEGVAVVRVPELSRHVGIVASRFYAEPSRHMQVVGITGTNGKTSCAQLTAQALTRLGRRTGVLGTLGYGLYGELQAGSHTTPDAVQLQALLAQFRTQGADHATMEVSSHALDQGRIAGVRFAVALFTNLTRDHLDYHGDLATYAAAKQKLFQMPELGWAVVNHDDPAGRGILAELPAGVQAVAYGLDEVPAGFAHYLRGRGLDLHPGGLRLQVDSDFGSGELSARLLGRFNASNLLAVLGALLALGVSFGTARETLAEARTVPGRMECFGGDRQPLVVVDYAHTPDALAQVLTAARAHCRGRLICVFGCGGDRDKGKRPEMGALAAALADTVIVTDDNPRTEDPERIVADILAGIRDRGNVSVARDRPRAVAQALDSARAGDVVLVAGKGHEDYQIVGTEKRPYSDRATVARLLGEARP